MKRIIMVNIVYYIVLATALLGVEIAYGQYYYLLCYGDVGRGNDRDVFLKSINLESGIIQDSILLMESGCIDTYTPIISQFGQNQYRLFFVVGGALIKIPLLALEDFIGG
jgi:hypothetical protein